MPLPSPWPGTAGGSWSPSWGHSDSPVSYQKVYVWIAIYAGSTMKWGASATARLNSGNVYGGGATTPSAPPSGTVWVDVSCDIQSVTVRQGPFRDPGMLGAVEAATCELTLIDPSRKYDPSNPNSPFQYGGQTRLTPGTRVNVFMENWNGTNIARHTLFTGSVDSWSEEWRPKGSDRVASVVASDDTKLLMAYDYGEQPAVGAGELSSARISRILTYYGFTGTSNLANAITTLQATTYDKPAWELMADAARDEIGVIGFIMNTAVLRYRGRLTFQTKPAPFVTFGCGAGVTGYDIIQSADIRSATEGVHNAVYATRKDGVQQVAKSDSSITRYGLHTLRITDLGILDDAQTGAWATFTLGLAATPRPRVESVTLLPRFDPTCWRFFAPIFMGETSHRIVYTDPLTGIVCDTQGRVAQWQASITRDEFSFQFGYVFADLFANRFRWGTHAMDRLNVGNVYV